jgi:(2Fe-2S) ferredoxin
MAKRKHYLFVCVNRREDGAPRGSCAARGAVQLHETLKKQLKEGGLAEFEARACTASCLDVCWAGPVVFIEPDGFAYGRVQVEDVPELIGALKEGRRVERLVLRDEEYQEPKARS